MSVTNPVTVAALDTTLNCLLNTSAGVVVVVVLAGIGAAVIVTLIAIIKL